MDANATALRIVDLVERRAIGQAQGALENALAKYPNDCSIGVAEALLLARSGAVLRAKEKAEALSQRSLGDPRITNALVQALQQCCSWAALADVYERLSSSQNTKDVQERLANTYVRMGAYAKAQQTATALYRQYKDPKYQVWMVQACLGQVPAGSPDHLMLKLATRLLDVGVLTDAGVLSPATVRTYVDILVQQALYKEAIDFLCGPRGARVGLVETRLELLADLLRQAGDTGRANAVARHLWLLRPDNWTPFELYMNTLAPKDPKVAKDFIELLDAKHEPQITIECKTADGSVEDAVALAKSLQEAEMKQRPSKPQRGPFMAELALLSRAQDAEALRAAVLAYTKRFYRQPCCFLDVSTFLSPESAADIYAWSTEAAAAEHDGEYEELDGHTRRILGLRCHVACWGLTSETQPADDAMRALFDACLAAYAAARPLSASLVWSEEGLCDGYVSVALNIALRGYARDGQNNLSWVLAGLAAMQHLDRRRCNPSWLIFSVCFANLLGLTDVAALHQLAFKSIQHDTMAHLGYTPLLRGLALDDVANWTDLAAYYYSTLERDCSALRGKVFTYISWPAMQDVQAFEQRQSNSIGRWLNVAEDCAVQVLDCQTQRDLFELFEKCGAELYAALVTLNTLAAEGRLVDNTDWLVARSVVLGNIHSNEVQRLTEALVLHLPLDARVLAGRQLLHSLLLLHDVTRLEQHRLVTANAPKPRKSKKNTTDVAVSAAPQLYCPKIAEASGGTLECLPTLQNMVPAVLAFVQSGGSLSAVHDAQLATALTSIVEADSSEPFETFFYPEAYILSALLQVGTAARLPVQQWAHDLHSALERAAQQYSSKTWSGVRAELNGDNAFTATLQQEKLSRVQSLIADLSVGVMASCRRK